MDTSEHREKQEVVETTDRKYQLTFEQSAGKKNCELQDQITKPVNLLAPELFFF